MRRFPNYAGVVVSHDAPHTAYLSLRIPRTLAADLKKAADREANSASAVARRLIATGLAREERDRDTKQGR